MTTLKDYILEKAILEKAEIEEFDTYNVVTLVRHENLDLSTIDEQTFINEMLADIKEAVEEYTALYTPYEEEKKRKFIERETEAARKYAEQKYKRESNRKKYVETAMSNIEEKWKRFSQDPKKIFFDIVPNPYQMGTSYEETLHYGADKKFLKKTYDILKDNKYFRKGIGWAFKYETWGKESPVFASRPYVDILMKESDKAEQKREKEMHSKAIEDFYSDSNYWGD